MHVLFVCTGNICRSPTAERLAEAYAEESRLQDFVASSAGTRAMVGYPIHEAAATVLRDLGGDASGFAARQLTAKVIQPAGLILTMTREHRDRVLEIAPSKLKRTYTLCEAARLRTECGAATLEDLPALRSYLIADEGLDIEDPIGKAASVFETVGQQIADLLQPIVEMCRLGSPSSPT
ncbi:arsenate reductase/protein-tyrosine-phosphatase family protein [Mycobacterium sp. ZZG]